MAKCCMDGFDDAPLNVRSKVMEKVTSPTVSVSVSLAIMCETDDHLFMQLGSQNHYARKKIGRI